MSFPGSGSVYSVTIKPFNTERTEHRRDLSVEALEARRPQRTSNLVAAHDCAVAWSRLPMKLATFTLDTQSPWISWAAVHGGLKPRPPTPGSTPFITPTLA